MDKKLFHEFVEQALVKNNRDTRKARGEEMPLPEKAIPPGAKLIELPNPDVLNDHEVSFLELMELRTTVRSYSAEALSKEELSYLLWCTQGVKMMLTDKVTRRTVPSAGCRHAFETYLYINRVEGLRPGLYRFLAIEHALLPIDLSLEVADRIKPCFNKLKLLEDSAVTFIWTADMDRMEYTFGGRSLQYLYIDSGHVCQNLYLAAYTIEAGVCAIGHFNDIELNSFLGLDGENDFVVYAAHVGKL